MSFVGRNTPFVCTCHVDKAPGCAFPKRGQADRAQTTFPRFGNFVVFRHGTHFPFSYFLSGKGDVALAAIKVLLFFLNRFVCIFGVSFLRPQHQTKKHKHGLPNSKLHLIRPLEITAKLDGLAAPYQTRMGFVSPILVSPSLKRCRPFDLKICFCCFRGFPQLQGFWLVICASRPPFHAAFNPHPVAFWSTSSGVLAPAAYGCITPDCL